MKRGTALLELVQNHVNLAMSDATLWSWVQGGLARPAAPPHARGPRYSTASTDTGGAMSGDWERVFGRETPWSDLQTIIDERIIDALHVWLQTLLDDHDLSDSQRAQVWAFAAPKKSGSSTAPSWGPRGATCSGKRRPQRRCSDGRRFARPVVASQEGAMELVKPPAPAPPAAILFRCASCGRDKQFTRDELDASSSHSGPGVIAWRRPCPACGGLMTRQTPPQAP
jgi:hypothetical protein